MQTLPLAEPLLVNPTYAGAVDCKRINMLYQKQLNYDYASFSYLHNFPKKDISVAILVSDKIQGRAINKFTAGAVFSKSIQINKTNIIELAMQVDYLQQHIITDNLIFRHQIQAETNSIIPSKYSYNFPVIKRPDFSLGVLYFTPKIRTGISLQNISQLYDEDPRLQIKSAITAHIGKSIKLKSKNKLIIPELFIQYYNKKIRFALASSIYYNSLSGQIAIKSIPQNRSLQTSIGVRIKHKKILYGYAYQITTTKSSTAIHTHSISLTFEYQCKSKRNKKNTIFCAKY